MQDSWKEKAIEYSLAILNDTLLEAVNDPFYNMKAPGTRVRDLSQYILNCFETYPENVLGYAKQLVTSIVKLVPASSKDQVVEKMIRQFNQTTVSNNTVSLWNVFLECIHVIKAEHISIMLLQYLMTKSLRHILRERNNYLIEDVEQFTEDDLKLSESEQNTLRYVAGYIPYSIKANLKVKKDSPAKKALLCCLGHWSQDDKNATEMDFLSFTKEWTNIINRGGLFLINDEFFIFIRRVENVARTILNNKLMISYAGEDLRKVHMEKFAKSSLIELSWQSLTKSLENRQLAATLKNLVLNKWINIRANAFVKAWVNIAKLKYHEEMIKKKNKTIMKDKLMDAKATPALRKGLSSKTSDTNLSEKAECSMRKQLPS